MGLGGGVAYRYIYIESPCMHRRIGSLSFFSNHKPVLSTQRAQAPPLRASHGHRGKLLGALGSKVWGTFLALWYVHISRYTCIYTYIYIHTYVHTYTHTYIQTFFYSGFQQAETCLKGDSCSLSGWGMEDGPVPTFWLLLKTL